MSDRIDRRKWLAEAEAEGTVADSMEYRLALVERTKRGEITFAEAQKELAKVKREAKKGGKVTRNQAYNGYRPPKPEAP